jgi:sialic acid synthase SpsE
LIGRRALACKPLIISRDIASLGELEGAVNTAKVANYTDLELLKRTSTYPTTLAKSNIRTLPNLRELFGCEVDLSDRTMGVWGRLSRRGPWLYGA